nr:hypothetical protein [Tanacetum cinerariifolium]
ISAFEDSDETEPFEEGETAATPPPFGYICLTTYIHVIPFGVRSLEISCHTYTTTISSFTYIISVTTISYAITYMHSTTTTTTYYTSSHQSIYGSDEICCTIYIYSITTIEDTTDKNTTTVTDAVFLLHLLN